MAFWLNIAFNTCPFNSCGLSKIQHGQLIIFISKRGMKLIIHSQTYGSAIEVWEQLSNFIQLYWACDYLLGLSLIHASKRGLWCGKNRVRTQPFHNKWINSLWCYMVLLFLVNIGWGKWLVAITSTNVDLWLLRSTPVLFYRKFSRYADKN